MGDSIDGFKPAAPSRSGGVSARALPNQQVREGRSGFDGWSYFDKGAGYTPSRDQHMLDPPATTGPKATVQSAIAKTLGALGIEPGAAIFIPPERA